MGVGVEATAATKANADVKGNTNKVETSRLLRLPLPPLQAGSRAASGGRMANYWLSVKPPLLLAQLRLCLPLLPLESVILCVCVCLLWLTFARLLAVLFVSRFFTSQRHSLLAISLSADLFVSFIRSRSNACLFGQPKWQPQESPQPEEDYVNLAASLW